MIYRKRNPLNGFTFSNDLHYYHQIRSRSLPGYSQPKCRHHTAESHVIPFNNLLKSFFNRCWGKIIQSLQVQFKLQKNVNCFLGPFLFNGFFVKCLWHPCQRALFHFRTDDEAALLTWEIRLPHFPPHISFLQILSKLKVWRYSKFQSSKIICTHRTRKNKKKFNPACLFVLATLGPCTSSLVLSNTLMIRWIRHVHWWNFEVPRHLRKWPLGTPLSWKRLPGTSET